MSKEAAVLGAVLGLAGSLGVSNVVDAMSVNEMNKHATTMEQIKNCNDFRERSGEKQTELEKILKGFNMNEDERLPRSTPGFPRFNNERGKSQNDQRAGYSVYYNGNRKNMS